MESDTTIRFIEIGTGCLPTLIWQAIVVAIIIRYRAHIGRLLEDLASFRVGETELTFQKPNPDAASPGGEAEEQLELLGPEGFFTDDGINQLIANSGLIEAGEFVVDRFLLFKTKRQRTWLVTTDRRLFCILDDENTQASGRLIQWRILLEEANPISAIPHKPTVGLINIGERRNWLYSRRLHPSTKGLENEVATMINRAAKAA